MVDREDPILVKGAYLAEYFYGATGLVALWISCTRSLCPVVNVPLCGGDGEWFCGFRAPAFSSSDDERPTSAGGRF